MTYPSESWPGGRKIRATTFSENGRRYRLDVEYGFHLLGGNRSPYFSITGTVRRIGTTGAPVGRDGGFERGGCLHDEIAERCPDLVPLIRWHLSDTSALPMHYVANAAYRMEQHLRVSQFQEPGSPWNRGRETYDKAEADPAVALDYFRRGAIFGAVPEEDTPEALAAIVDSIQGIDLNPEDSNPAVAEALRQDAFKTARARIRGAVARWAERRRAGLLAAMRADMEPFGIDVDAAIAAIRPEAAPTTK